MARRAEAALSGRGFGPRQVWADSMEQGIGSLPARGLALLALALWMQACALAGPLRVVTEDYPPYSYLEAGRVTGYSTAVVRAVLAEAGLEAEIQLIPWARAYDLALHDEQVLIYSIARTPAREHKFRWIGQVAPSEWFLYSLRGHELGLRSLGEAYRELRDEGRLEPLY